jgi:GrpB-like predicted nucleotidyltransferase (UPF0157 family)
VTTSDEYLARVTIGERKPHDAPILLAPYDASWPARYERLAARIREPEWLEHRLLNAVDVDCNVHVFSAGCAEVDRMVRFRDRLREHEADRRRYETAKRELAARTWRHVQHYADAKADVVRAILSGAG